MAGQANAAPVIIKRKKIVIAGGHHGGAWKVAYADFVTAMMAFFMLMWLLNATTERQRKGIADYFSPTIAINRSSGGGDGLLGGSSVTSVDIMTQIGKAGLADRAQASTANAQTLDKESAQRAAEDERLAEVEKSLLARSGESMSMQRLLRHVVTRVTDEGLVIELFDINEAPLFDAESNRPTQTLRSLATIVAEVLAHTENALAIGGYLRSYPLTIRENPVWPLSAARAQEMRSLLRLKGLEEGRFARVTGFADKKPLTPDASLIRNNRVEVVLLRNDR